MLTISLQHKRRIARTGQLAAKSFVLVTLAADASDDNAVKNVDHWNNLHLVDPSVPALSILSWIGHSRPNYQTLIALKARPSTVGHCINEIVRPSRLRLVCHNAEPTNLTVRQYSSATPWLLD